MGKLPAYLFYTKDWRTDPALCRVSKTARDTWMDMNCLMFDSEERGLLVSGGTPWTDEQIARATRGEYLTNLRDIAELLDMGVAFRDNRGAIFCKRMVRDEQERIAAKKRKRQSRLSHTIVTAKSPIETASERDVGFEVDVGSKSKPKPSLKEAEEIYDCYPRKVGKAAALKAITNALTRLMAGEYMTKALTPTEALAGLKQRTLTFAESIAGNRGNFTPHPATWFNRSSYLDDPKEWNVDDRQQQASPPRSVERACNNVAAIRAGLDLGGNAPAVRDDAGKGSDLRGNQALGADVRERIAREIALGVPRTSANLKVLS